MVYLERIISITYLYVKIMNRIKGKKHFPRLKKKKKKNMKLNGYVFTFRNCKLE